MCRLTLDAGQLGIMGCRKSKPVKTVHESINAVLEFDNTQPFSNANKKNISLADKIKDGRRQTKNKINKSVKYDSKIIAKYDIKATLGKGKFTKVLRVENKYSKQPFALKVLEKKEGLDTLETEISILRRVKSKHIINLIEVFVSDHRQRSVTIAAVLELTTGGDLFDRLFAGGLYSERDAVKVLSQVLDGVQYLHSIGITHRDLKPNNILYYQPGHDSRVVITDFGMAYTRKSAEDVLMYDLCGTPEYLAPEVVARQPYTQAVDLWAIGVISYVILRGDFPFVLATDNKIELFKAIAKAEYSLEDEVWQAKSAPCREFVSKLLCREGARRPTAAQALLHPWMLTRHPPQARRWDKGERSGSSSSSASSVQSLQRLRSASTLSMPPPPARRRQQPSHRTDGLPSHYQSGGGRGHNRRRKRAH